MLNGEACDLVAASVISSGGKICNTCRRINNYPREQLSSFTHIIDYWTKPL